jgi:hypothetical protein
LRTIEFPVPPKDPPVRENELEFIVIPPSPSPPPKEEEDEWPRWSVKRRKHESHTLILLN